MVSGRNVGADSLRQPGRDRRTDSTFTANTSTDYRPDRSAYRCPNDSAYHPANSSADDHSN